MATNNPHILKDTLLPQSDGFFEGTDRDTSRTVLDPTVRGGQYGGAPKFWEYVSEHVHIDQQGWCFVLSSPTFFSKFKFGKFLHGLTKSMFETRSYEWQGPSEKYDFSFAEQKVGGRTHSIPSGGSRTLGPFSLKLYDVVGEPYTSLIRIWGIWGIHDTDLGYARMVILDDLKPGDILIDKRSASIICFNTSEDLRDISHASMIVGMMPRSTVEVDIRRNKEEEGKKRDISMEFTGLIEFDSMFVRQVARTFLKKIPLFNPDARRAEAGFDTPTANLSGLTKVGIYEQMKAEAAKVDNQLFTS